MSGTFGIDSVLTVVDGEIASLCVPFGSNSLQHGTAVFDSVRSHTGPGGPLLFRLGDHVQRLLHSADHLGIRHGYDAHRLAGEILRAAALGGLGDCYLRPAFVTSETRLGVDLARFGFRLAVEVWPAGPAPASAAAVRIGVSPWCRHSARTFPVTVKATGGYAVSALARTQAGVDGFDDAVQLDPDSGRVAEATVSNVFVVRDGRLLTPWLQDSLLPGITRSSVLALAARLDVPFEEGPLTVEDLLAADEVFLTGTASGLVPVRAVEGRDLPADRPVQRLLSQAYSRAVRGLAFEDLGWTEPVPLPVPPSRQHL